MPLPFTVQKNRMLSELGTFGIGGPAKECTEVRTIEEMQKALEYSYTEKLRFLILGKGSNCLFDDRGFNGLVILNKIDFLQNPEENVFYAGAGYSFSLLGTQTAKKGFTGLEFASGIPGSVGGAVFMNAGANGKETSETLKWVDYVSETGQLQRFSKEQLQFAYRTSSFQNMPGAIVAAAFLLSPQPNARTSQMEIISYRKKTQPYNQMSAGCVFRNPTQGHAGALIDQSGLKGTQIGGAKVSEVHANFIVNVEHATAQNVLDLIEMIKCRVQEKKGVVLESEVRFIPYE